jgi:hypothetical protein
MISRKSIWYCRNKFSALFLYQCVVRYDQWHVDWSCYFRRSCDRSKLPRLSAKLITRTTRGCSFRYTDCYVLAAWRIPFSLYLHCDATSQWHFPYWWTSHGSTITWPPRSPDLTPLDFCLWGWMNSEVYRRKVNTRDRLLDNGCYHPHKGTS